MSSLSRFAGLGRGDKCGGDYYRLRREAWTGECGILGFWEAEKARRRCRLIAGRAHASDAGLRLLGHDGCHSCLAVMLRVLWFLGNAGESLRSRQGRRGGLVSHNSAEESRTAENTRGALHFGLDCGGRQNGIRGIA